MCSIPKNWFLQNWFFKEHFSYCWPPPNTYLPRGVLCVQILETDHIDFSDIQFKLKIIFFCKLHQQFCNLSDPLPIWGKVCGLDQWQIRTRIAEHKSKMKNRNLEAPLTQYFIECQHCPDGFKFLTIGAKSRNGWIF